ncbi:MAG: hypothetical protein WCW64_00685 [Phycisphaerae bacterium]
MKRLKVLHLEDYDPEKGEDYAKELYALLYREKIEYTNIETLVLFKSLRNLQEFDFIVLDGQFPEISGNKPDVASFSKALESLQSNRYPKEKIIVWSNSTRVHAICKEKGLCYFSKKQMKEQDYIEKKVDVSVIATKAATEDIALRLCRGK